MFFVLNCQTQRTLFKLLKKCFFAGLDRILQTTMHTGLSCHHLARQCIIQAVFASWGRHSKCLVRMLLKHTTAQNASEKSCMQYLEIKQTSWGTQRKADIHHLLRLFSSCYWFYLHSLLFLWEVKQTTYWDKHRLAALFCEMGNKQPSSPCHHSWVFAKLFAFIR